MRLLLDQRSVEWNLTARSRVNDDHSVSLSIAHTCRRLVPRRTRRLVRHQQAAKALRFGIFGDMEVRVQFSVAPNRGTVRSSLRTLGGLSVARRVCVGEHQRESGQGVTQLWRSCTSECAIPWMDQHLTIGPIARRGDTMCLESSTLKSGDVTRCAGWHGGDLSRTAPPIVRHCLHSPPPQSTRKDAP